MVILWEITNSLINFFSFCIQRYIEKDIKQGCQQWKNNKMEGQTHKVSYRIDVQFSQQIIKENMQTFTSSKARPTDRRSKQCKKDVHMS